MSVINGENFFLLAIGLAFLELVLLGPVMLIMHFLMPKAVLKKYFKPPYFRAMEVELFTGIPYAPMRTIMLMSVLAFPQLGKKRHLTEAYLSSPLWYRVCSGVLVTSILVALIGILSIALGFYIYFDFLGHN